MIVETFETAAIFVCNSERDLWIWSSPQIALSVANKDDVSFAAELSPGIVTEELDLHGSN